jgi:hypothetical protein
MKTDKTDMAKLCQQAVESVNLLAYTVIEHDKLESEVLRIIKERDELLAACKQALDDLNKLTLGSPAWKSTAMLNVAIANAESR